jgi:dinuclear metal center YbgI/SA1388 family protein
MPLVALSDIIMSQYCIHDVADYLDRYLRVHKVPDDPRALNGLQVENSGRLGRVVAAVDACQASIDGAAASEAGLLLVHHGLFWGGLEPLIGRQGRRVRALHAHDVAVYAAHLPLDCHPQVGNNAVLARELGVRDVLPFGEEDGVAIGLVGSLTVPRGGLVEMVGRLLKVEPRLLAFGPSGVKRIAIVTGAGSKFVRDARAAGADTLITGEGPHHSYLDAEESGTNVIFAGHYATETVGVKALAAHIADRFNVPWEFFDHPTGL